VGVGETFADGVGIFVGIGVTMMSTVISGPPSDRSFNSPTSNSGEEYSKRKSGGVGSVCPKTMVASCDTKSSPKVVDDSEERGLQTKRSPDCLDASVEGNSQDEGDVQPVDMLVPVGSRHGRLSDVSLLGVVGFGSVWLRGFGHTGGLGGERLGLGGEVARSRLA